MPYIKLTERMPYCEHIDSLVEELAEADFHPGHLNFIIYSLIKEVFERNRSYTEGNKLLGVLSAVSQEFYRRLLAPYEQEKIEENGDV